MWSKWNKILISASAVFTACAAPDEDFTIILRSSPASGEITVQTFSPFVEEGRGAFKTDESSQFVLSYDMSRSSPDS